MWHLQRGRVRSEEGKFGLLGVGQLRQLHYENVSAYPPTAACRAGGALTDRRVLTPLPLRHSELRSSNLVGTIPNAIGAFVDMETFNVFGNRRLNGSLPASMSAWKKLKFFDVRGTKFNGALPALNYRAMTTCTLCDAAFFGKPGCHGNAFSCPFPQGVTDRCQKFNGDMEYQPIANADCYNTTAWE